MSYRQIPVGSTDQVVHVALPSGLAFDDPQLRAYFYQPGNGLHQAIELVERMGVDLTHTPGGWTELLPGVYELCLPNEAALLLPSVTTTLVVVAYGDTNHLTQIDLR